MAPTVTKRALRSHARQISSDCALLLSSPLPRPTSRADGRAVLSSILPFTPNSDRTLAPISTHSSFKYLPHHSVTERQHSRIGTTLSRLPTVSYSLILCTRKSSNHAPISADPTNQSQVSPDDPLTPPNLPSSLIPPIARTTCMSLALTMFKAFSIVHAPRVHIFLLYAFSTFLASLLLSQVMWCHHPTDFCRLAEIVDVQYRVRALRSPHLLYTRLRGRGRGEGSACTLLGGRHPSPCSG